MLYTNWKFFKESVHDLRFIKVSLTLKRQSCHHIETSQLVCRANQLTGFYMVSTLAFNELKYLFIVCNLDNSSLKISPYFL